MTRTEMIDAAVRSVDRERVAQILACEATNRERCKICRETVRRIRWAFWMIGWQAQAEAAQARWRA